MRACVEQLIDSARVSTDMQLYHALAPELLTRLFAARERSVRVRLLLDPRAMTGKNPSSRRLATAVGLLGALSP